MTEGNDGTIDNVFILQYNTKIIKELIDIDKNNQLSDSYKKVSVSSMLTYLRGLSIENLESIIKWAKASKNPGAAINTANPSEWEKSMKMIFTQLNYQEQAEVISQASKILDEKKSNELKANTRR